MAFYGCISKIKEKKYKKISHLLFEKEFERTCLVTMVMIPKLMMISRQTHHFLTYINNNVLYPTIKQ